MKFTFTVLLQILVLHFALAQATGIPDTILLQTFNEDPSNTMLEIPSGDDLEWVNWDADNLATSCGTNGSIVPGNWYWESDIGDPNDPPINYAFTSCSWLKDTTKANENWLITPPLHIPDSITTLYWRSLSFEGPGYLDGYKVLVSTESNAPYLDDFTDTIFVAAEMKYALVGGSFDPDDYIFSPGYVHADTYTDTNYFFLADPDAYSYTGRLEPHSISLAAYAGKQIYIAFLHDSRNDNILQIDDITVIHLDTISSTKDPRIVDFLLRISPNPVWEKALVTWKINSGDSGHLVLSDFLGQTVLNKNIDNLASGSERLDFSHYPAGVYTCSLITKNGRQTVLLVKQ